MDDYLLATDGCHRRDNNALALELDYPDGLFEQHPEHEGFDVITPEQYINWVNRSLNRLYGARLVANAMISKQYRDLVRRLQRDSGIPVIGDVDSSTQNALIKASEGARPYYLTWVQRALESDGIFADPPRASPDSKGSFKSHGLGLGIRTFQRRQGLAVDGYVGAKTEVLLIQTCGGRSPGHIAPKPHPQPPKPPNPASGKRVPLRYYRHHRRACCALANPNHGGHFTPSKGPCRKRSPGAPRPA